MSSSYINRPKTPREHLDNCQFQIANVEGWLGASDLQVARIKAECLLRDATALVQSLSETENGAHGVTRPTEVIA